MKCGLGCGRFSALVPSASRPQLKNPQIPDSAADSGLGPQPSPAAQGHPPRQRIPPWVLLPDRPPPGRCRWFRGPANPSSLQRAYCGQQAKCPGCSFQGWTLPPLDGPCPHPAPSGALPWPCPALRVQRGGSSGQGPAKPAGGHRSRLGATHRSRSSLPLSGSRSWLVRAETRSGSTGLGHGGGVGKEGGARCSRFQASWGLGRPCSAELSLGAKMPLP